MAKTCGLQISVWVTLKRWYGWYFWINDAEHGYFAHAIYLLPGQMIPEHAHVKTKFPAKHESWMVEKGWVYNFSVLGDETPNAPAIPASHGPIKSKNFVVQKVGDVLRLKELESFHFMMAGPEGAIVDEWACYHDNDGFAFHKLEGVSLTPIVVVNTLY